jgi:hypothetical protein
MSTYLRIVTYAACAMAAGQALAADAGRVVLAAGDTTALRQGQAVRLTLGALVQDRDTLRTGANSNLQVRFEDDSYVSMRPDSEVQVQEFRYAGKNDGSERASFNLVKGGLRAITGAIGRLTHDNYRMTTPTATIGIRGTDYAATLCQGDCRNADGSPARDGLYGRVIGQSNGTNQIEVSNDADRKVFGINSNFFTAGRNSPVEALLVAPDFVLSKLEGRGRGGSKGSEGGTGSEKSSSGGASDESRPSNTPPPLPQLQFVSTQELNPQGLPAVLPPANGFVVAFPGRGGLFGTALFDDSVIPGTFNSLNQLTSFGSGSLVGSLGGGTITDTGSLTLSNGQVFVWGRWTGPTSVPLFNNSSGFVNTSNVPLLFGTATGVQNQNSVVGTLGGVATYTYSGGPKPVDGGGNVGSITSTSTTINFTTLQQQLSLAMNFPSVLVSGSNTGSATFNLNSVVNPGVAIACFGGACGDFGGILAGTCTGGGCASGSPSGFFQTALAGPIRYDLAVVTGLVDATLAGQVAFLNTYQLASFTPGPLPVGPLAGQVAWADPVNAPGSTFSVGTATSTVNSSFDLTSFVNPVPCSTGTCTLSATLGSGTVVNRGSTTLVDGSTMVWGRWSGGQITDRIAGTPTTYTPPGGVPFVLGNANTTLPTSGSFVYSFAGGPAATNTAGSGSFSLNQGAFNVSFGSNLGMSIATPLQFFVPGSGNYSLNSLATLNSTACPAGNCSVVPGIIQNMTFNATCSGGCTSVTSATGTNIFVGPQAGGMAVAGNVISNAPTVTFAGAFKR